jgi:hypothetical protein
VPVDGDPGISREPAAFLDGSLALIAEEERCLHVRAPLRIVRESWLIVAARILTSVYASTGYRLRTRPTRAWPRAAASAGYRDCAVRSSHISSA